MKAYKFSFLILTVLLVSMLYVPPPVQAQNDQDVVGYGGYISKTRFNSEDLVTYYGSVMNRGDTPVLARAFVVFFIEILPSDAIRQPRNNTLREELPSDINELNENETISYTMESKVDLGFGNYYASIYFEIAPRTQPSTKTPTLAYAAVNITVEITNVPTSTKVLLYAFISIFVLLLAVIVYLYISGKRKL